MGELTETSTELPILSTLEQTVVEQYIMGKSKREIATELGLPPKDVTALLNRKDVINYLTVAQREFENARKDRMLALMNRVVDDRIKKIEEEGGDFSDLTRKDTLDVIALMDQIQKEREKAELGNDKQSIYINLVQQLMD